MSLAYVCQMIRAAQSLVTVAVLLGSSLIARADSVFEVCKGESKTAVAGTGKMSIAVVYPEGFPATTTPVMRNAIGAVLARAERAKIVPAKDVEAATKLVTGRKWTDKSDVCGFAPSLIAVLGQTTVLLLVWSALTAVGLAWSGWV